MKYHVKARESQLIDIKKIDPKVNLGILLILTFVSGACKAADTETVLHNFSEPGGRYPSGPLIKDSSGALYGTAQDGYTKTNRGLVYKLTPPVAGQNKWTYTPLWVFQAQKGNGFPDGASPLSGVIFGPNGTLYGTTAGGGTDDGGVVFQLAPPPQAKLHGQKKSSPTSTAQQTPAYSNSMMVHWLA